MHAQYRSRSDSLPTQASLELRWGSSYEEAYNRLVTNDFKIDKIIRFTSEELKTTFLTSRENLHDQYAIQGLNGKVYMIDHKVDFAQGGQPNIEDTIDNLKQKYGRVTSQFEPNALGQSGWYAMMWVYDNNGTVRPLAGPQSVTCPTFGLQSNDLSTVMPSNNVLNSKCEKFVTVFILGNSLTHTITTLRVCAVDGKEYRALLEPMAVAV